mgnify:CR=1 FL=1
MVHDMSKLSRLVKRLALAALVAVVAGCGSSGSGGGGGGGGGGTTNTRTISGVITNAYTSAVISGATVAASGRTTSTDANGAYTLTQLPNTGSITITASKTGFTSNSVVVTNTSQAQANIALSPTGGVDVTQPPSPPVFD